MLNSQRDPSLQSSLIEVSLETRCSDFLKQGSPRRNAGCLSACLSTSLPVMLGASEVILHRIPGGLSFSSDKQRVLGTVVRKNKFRGQFRTFFLCLFLVGQLCLPRVDGSRRRLGEFERCRQLNAIPSEIQDRGDRRTLDHI